MVIQCPECGGKVSDTRKDCPHCGYQFRNTEPKQTAPEQKPEKHSVMSVFGYILKGTLLFLLILFGVILLVLCTDFRGSRTELRSMCMTDSGTGGKVDSQTNRIAVKYYILQVLNLIDGGGTGDLDYTPKQTVGTPVQDPGTVHLRVERPPLKLPPSPQERAASVPETTEPQESPEEPETLKRPALPDTEVIPQ